MGVTGTVGAAIFAGAAVGTSAGGTAARAQPDMAKPSNPAISSKYGNTDKENTGSGPRLQRAIILSIISRGPLEGVSLERLKVRPSERGGKYLGHIDPH